jgi:hypothetical protein
MTSTMERPVLSNEVIAKMRERFADECKRMLEQLAVDTNCVCGVGKQAQEHDADCPVAVFRRAAHAVWLWGQP